MEPINYGNTYFTRKGMMPDEGEDLTVNWGRAIVHNLANGYGLIGTLVIDTRDTVWAYVGLQYIYNFPPRVHYLYEINGNGTLFQGIDSSHQQSFINVMIQGDLIGFRVHTLLSQRPTGTNADGSPSGWTDHKIVKIFYRIHGV